MKQELDIHAAELQQLADIVTRAQVDPPSRKKRDKLLATIGPALQSAAEKARRLRDEFQRRSAESISGHVIGDGKPRTLGELNHPKSFEGHARLQQQVQAISLEAAEACQECGADPQPAMDDLEPRA